MTTYTTKKISQRTPAGTLTGDEILPVVRPDDTGDYKTTLTLVRNYILTDATFLTLLDDKFAEHIVEGFDAEFGEVLQTNAADTSTWGSHVDVDGNWVFEPESGLEAGLILNSGGTVRLGITQYLTLIQGHDEAAYTLIGYSDRARHLRFTCLTDPVVVTIQRDADVGDPFDLFGNHDWISIERATTQPVTLTQGTGVQIMNARTGVIGNIALPFKGAVVMLRRTGLNAYLALGDVPARHVETVIPLTSASGVLTIDWSLGNMFTLTLTENITSVVFSNLPSGAGQPINIRITQHASSAKTITGWPAGMKFRGGTYQVTADLGAIDVLGAYCYGDGTTVLGPYGQDFVAP